MNSWKTVKLGDIADFSNGINFDKTAYSRGIKLIGVSNFGNRFFPPYDELEEVKEEVVRSNDYLKINDIVFVRSNGNKELVGRCMLINDTSVPLTYSGFCIRCRIKDTNSYDPIFFTYYFKSMLFRHAMSGSAVGANIQNLSQGRLAVHEMKVPDILLQRKIADILFNYDRLIDNNQKQIRLLEETAQRIYKEWFVKLRFPGYEDIRIVDGVPEGWKKDKVGILFTTVLGGTPSREKSEYWGGKIPWINSGEVNKLRIIKESEFITESGLEKSSTKLMPKHTTVLAITGATLGQVSYTEIETCANQSVVGIYDNSNVYSEYIYLAISNEIKGIIAEAIGGAQQHINKEVVNKFSILLPDAKVNELLKKVIRPLFEKITILYFEIEKLVEARDRLLPKLMSGEIEL